jgi:hypothetical protein
VVEALYDLEPAIWSALDKLAQAGIFGYLTPHTGESLGLDVDFMGGGTPAADPGRWASELNVEVL